MENAKTPKFTPVMIDTINNQYGPIVREVFDNFVKREGRPVFHACSNEDRRDLADIFQTNLPTYNLGEGECRVCANWLNVYGDLVWHESDGTVRTLWSNYKGPDIYKSLFATMETFVKEAYEESRSERNDVGVSVWHNNTSPENLPVYPDNAKVGQAVAGGFHHLHLDWMADVAPMNYSPSRYRSIMNAALNFGYWVTQSPAILDRMQTVLNFLVQQTESTHIRKSITALTECLVVFKDLDRKTLESDYVGTIAYVRGNAHRLREHMYAIRSGALSVLIEDTSVAGEVSEASFREYCRLTDPSLYKRVTREFSEKHLREAEQILESTELGKALKRRYIRKSDLASLPHLWINDNAHRARKPLNLLGELNVKSETNTADALGQPKKEVKCSLQTFMEKYLPSISDLYYRTHARPDSYCSITTAEDITAPEIFQWPGHLSHWTYTRGSDCRQWGLRAGEGVRITTIMRGPEHGSIGWDTRRNKRLVFGLEAGAHVGDGMTGLWKEYISRSIPNYDKLINVIAAYNEKTTIPMDPEQMVFVSAAEGNIREFVLWGMVGDIWTQFTITSWE